MANRIVFTAPDRPAFVRYDLKVLKERYNVYEDILPWLVKWSYPGLFVFQFFSLLIQVPRSNAVICSFGGYWCLLPSIFGKLFKKPVFIVLNGTDCCAAPAIKYGVLRKWLPKQFCSKSYSLATLLVPISKSLLKSNDSYSKELVGHQGIQTHFPNLKTSATVIPYGFDTDFWKYDAGQKRPHQFLAVVLEQQYDRRDISTLLELFKRNEDWNLTIVGALPQKANIPPNVTIISWMNQVALRDRFCKSSYYIQLSLYEGFGCSMAEAMACGCIPIGTAVNAIPEIIGNTGIVFEERNVNAMESITRTFLEKGVTPEARLTARNQIISNYPLNKRRQALFKLLNDEEDH